MMRQVIVNASRNPTSPLKIVDRRSLIVDRRSSIVDQELSAVGRGTSPSAICPHVSDLQQNLCNKPRGSGEEEIFELQNRRILYYWRRTEGFLTVGAEQKDSLFLEPKRKDSLLLEPNRRILYYWSRTNGFFTRIIYYWRSTEGFVTVGAEQKDSLVLAPNRRILYCWAEQKDSLV